MSPSALQSGPPTSSRRLSGQSTASPSAPCPLGGQPFRSQECQLWHGAGRSPSDHGYWPVLGPLCPHEALLSSSPSVRFVRSGAHIHGQSLPHLGGRSPIWQVSMIGNVSIRWEKTHRRLPAGSSLPLLHPRQHGLEPLLRHPPLGPSPLSRCL